jgi:Ca2+-binding EF-hand superfamily protein
LDKAEFVRLYLELKPEPDDKLDEIAANVFKAFDKDNNGTINFNEFMVAYALTSKGNNEEKLAYAFELYDLDGNGSLDRGEIKAVLFSMLDMLGADDQEANVERILKGCLKDLDATGDGKVSKGKKIYFL